MPLSITAAIPPLSTAADVAAVADTLDSTTIAVIGGGSVAALAAVLSSPTREAPANAGGGGWRRGQGGGPGKDIRLGHSKTVENVMKMLLDEGPLSGITVCDAGCGTGCLSIPLAKEGAVVAASDISAAMVAEAEKQDLESLGGKYNTVVCLDVLIHYPQNKADAMIAHLASLAENRLILSFAPKTFYYDLLKRVGELFPGPSRRQGHIFMLRLTWRGRDSCIAQKVRSDIIFAFSCRVSPQRLFKAITALTFCIWVLKCFVCTVTYVYSISALFTLSDDQYLLLNLSFRLLPVLIVLFGHAL
ncbi:hypothetical protein DH2020_038428 [Rehmannia glutinosa]|uniref:Magnesium-protoporphyrin IX methyltransferase C-terminal domain-containing protein n=1 Tax=Rehmannia glutinosa TaxID=99300 RepID=A0ABR0V186_REHGL